MEMSVCRPVQPKQCPNAAFSTLASDNLGSSLLAVIGSKAPYSTDQEAQEGAMQNLILVSTAWLESQCLVGNHRLHNDRT